MMKHSRVYVAVSVCLVVMVGAFLLLPAFLHQGNLVLMKDTESRLTAKNLVAVSGDTVSIVNGRIIVNGEPTSFTVEQSLPWGPLGLPRFRGRVRTWVSSALLQLSPLVVDG